MVSTCHAARHQRSEMIRFETRHYRPLHVASPPPRGKIARTIGLRALVPKPTESLTGTLLRGQRADADAWAKIAYS